VSLLVTLLIFHMTLSVADGKFRNIDSHNLEAGHDILLRVEEEREEEEEVGLCPLIIIAITCECHGGLWQRFS